MSVKKNSRKKSSVQVAEADDSSEKLGRAVRHFVSDELATSPSYYRSDTPHEAIDVIQAWELGFCLGNAVKYICRAGANAGSPAEADIEKAIWYLQRALIEKREI